MKVGNHCARHRRTPFLPLFPTSVLHGLDLESEHCVFENVGGTVTLIPLRGSQCSVNGVQILEATHLNQGIGFWFSVLCTCLFLRTSWLGNGERVDPRTNYCPGVKRMEASLDSSLFCWSISL